MYASRFLGRLAAVAAAGVLAGSLALPAAAGSISGPMLVSATVLNSCLAVAPAPLPFGDYDPASGTATNAATTIVVTCTPGTAATVTLDAGQNATTATSFGQRALKFASTTLPYQIYTDAARTHVWGDGVNGGSLSVPVTGTATLNAYGQIPAGASVTAGLYTDTINVTVTF